MICRVGSSDDGPTCDDCLSTNVVDDGVLIVHYREQIVPTRWRWLRRDYSRKRSAWFWLGLRSFRLRRVLGLGRSGRLCSKAKKRSPLSLPTSYLFIRELTPLKLLRRSSVLAQFGVACCPCALDHLPRQYGTKKSKMLFSFISSLRIGFNVRSDDATCLLSSRQSCKEFGHCQPPFSKRSIGLYSTTTCRIVLALVGSNARLSRRARRLDASRNG